MALDGTRTFVGFGFGSIQAGLFLREAFQSDNFRRLVVAEVVPEVVARLRQAGGFYRVNIAHPDRIETAEVGPIEPCDPALPEDRRRLVEAVAEAQEIATAIPNVSLYGAGGASSVRGILAEGLLLKVRRGGPRAAVYAAENHNRAARLLEELVLEEVPPGKRNPIRSRVCFLDTVIGKISGVVTEPTRRDLAPFVPGAGHAFLVEAFNAILVSRVRFHPPFRRGIEVFEEKDDLQPFEEAKLFGHNATHALAAYLGRMMGLERMAEVRDAPGLMPFLRRAFLEESGKSLIRRHRGRDPLFTCEGFRHYAEDLLERMTNPFLMDTVERVGRDPRRKLGWNDRLVGTMRLALSEGVEPIRYALGAAAASAALDPRFLDSQEPVLHWMEPIWSPEKNDPLERQRVSVMIEEARKCIRAWREAGFPDLERFLRERQK